MKIWRVYSMTRYINWDFFHAPISCAGFSNGAVDMKKWNIHLSLCPPELKADLFISHPIVKRG
jgi:hypothetical protein